MSGDDVGSLVDRFLKGNNYQPATKRAYTADLHHFAQTLPQGTGLLNVSSELISKYIHQYRSLSRCKRQQVHQPAAESTKARKTACLRRFYRWCLKTRLISTNPVKLKVNLPPHATRITSEEDIVAMIGKCDDKEYGRRDAAIIASIAGLGLKVGQVATLNNEDISLKPERSVTVNYQKEGMQRSRIVLLPEIYERPLANYLGSKSNDGIAFFQNKHKNRRAERR